MDLSVPRGLRSDTIVMNVRDACCLLPAALSCLRYQVLEEKHDSAQPKASAHCLDIFCADMCARVLHICESWIRAVWNPFSRESKLNATGGAGLSAPPRRPLCVAARLKLVFDMECGGCRPWVPSCRFQDGAVVGALTTWRVGPAQLCPADDKNDLRQVSQHHLFFILPRSALRSAPVVLASNLRLCGCGIASRTWFSKWPDVDTQKLHAATRIRSLRSLWRSARICLFFLQRYR